MKKIIVVCVAIGMMLALNGLVEAGITDRPEYKPSTDLVLGAWGSEWGGSMGFVIADPFQLNLLYQPGVLNSDIDAINDYDPYGTWTVNFSDNVEYVLNINLAGLPVYTYPAGNAAEPGIQWTLTGWHQTILAGKVVVGSGSVFLEVVPKSTYRPFPDDPPVNDVEVFSGNVACEVLGYTFYGNLNDIGEGSRLEVSLIPAPGAVLLGTIGVSIVGWLRRRKTL